MPVLTPEDMAFWEENGYVVVRNAVPKENVEALTSAIWEFIGMSPDDPESWYPEPPRTTSMIEMYHHQAIWNNRQSPRIYEAYTQIHGTEKLWTSIDRVSLNPPMRSGVWERALPLHWDMDITKRPLRAGVQGVIYLTDAEEGLGGFECVPGFHRDLADWLDALPDGADPTEEMRKQVTAEPIPGKAGDMVIWTTLLPHGHGMNRGTFPRMANYVTLFPAPDDDEKSRQHRIRGWRERRTGLPQEELGREHEEGVSAELTPLGRKLLGLDRW